MVDTISKLRWLSEGLFIWGGQSKQCSGVAPFFISTAFTIVADLLETAYQMWSYRKKGKEKHFSWATLWWQLVKGFGTPALQAYLFYRQSFSTSVFTLLQIFLLTPKIAPIIGFVSPFLIGKTWAVQLLTVDTLLAIASLYTPYVTIMNLLNTGSIQSQDTPSGMWIVSLGTLLTVIPGLGVALLYMASGVVMWAFFILGCIFKTGWPFRFGFTLLIFWLALIFFFVISPIFALWEIGWKAFAGKERKFEFPPLRWVEDAMGSTSWVAKFLKYFGYWFWCLVQLAVFVGRWMILANLLPLAGEAFCPSKAKEIATGSALFALGIAATSIGLSAAGLTY